VFRIVAGLFGHALRHLGRFNAFLDWIDAWNGPYEIALLAINGSTRLGDEDRTVYFERINDAVRRKGDPVRQVGVFSNPSGARGESRCFHSCDFWLPSLWPSMRPTLSDPGGLERAATAIGQSMGWQDQVGVGEPTPTSLLPAPLVITVGSAGAAEVDPSPLSRASSASAADAPDSA
jgi:hypothetical protein